MREKLPRNFLRFKKAYPDVYEAFEELGRRLHETGTLSERERRLVKLGIAIGLGTEGGVHSVRARRRLLEGRRLPCREARHHDDRVAARARRDELGGGSPRWPPGRDRRPPEAAHLNICVTYASSAAAKSGSSARR